MSRTSCGAVERLAARAALWPSTWRAYAAPALAALGDKQRATKLAREQLAAARRVGAPGALGMSLRTAALAIGGDEGLALLREAVAVLEHSPARLELAHALADLGAELAAAAGGRRAGTPSAGRSAWPASAVPSRWRNTRWLGCTPGPGAAPDRADGAERADRGGAAGVPSGAGGQTNREVAQALFVTEKTVERHLSSAYQKLGIRSRFQLASAIGQ